MELVIYSTEFWKRANELLDKRIHTCERCGRKKGEPRNPNDKESGNPSAQIPRVHVRPVLLGNQPFPENLILGCEACFPGPSRFDRADKKTSKQIVNKLTVPMFGNAK